MKLNSFPLFLLLSPLFLTCNLEKPKETASGQNTQPHTTIKFKKTSHDFGQIKASEEGVKCTFPFTNTGKAPLIISKVNTSCGCVAATWPKAPIEPGETGKIEVNFLTKGRKYNQIKAVTVYANAEPEKTVLRILAEMI